MGAFSNRLICSIFTPALTAGLAPLADHPELTRLDVDATPVDDRAIPVLKGLTKLKFLVLTGTKLTPAGADELCNALPRCLIFNR